MIVALRALALAALLAPTLACHDHHHDEEQFICDGNEDSFAAGTQKLGNEGKLMLEIVESIPEQHYTGGADIDHNELILLVKDAEGNLVSDASFDRVEPFTAKHDHGTPLEPVVEATVNEGEFHITELAYVHRGPWRIDIDLSGAGESDFVQFVFCIEDHPSVQDAGGE